MREGSSYNENFYAPIVPMNLRLWLKQKNGVGHSVSTDSL